MVDSLLPSSHRSPGKRCRAPSLTACLLTALAFPLTVGAQGAESPLLVSAEELARDRAQALVLHVDTTSKAFEEGHIAGARWLPYRALVTNRQVDGGTLINEIADQEAIVETMRGLGVNSDSWVVLYGHPVLTARAFMTLDVLGHPSISILDGGLEAWRAAGQTVRTGAARAAEPGDFSARPKPAVLVDATWVEANRSSSEVALVDSRPLAEYTGADGGMGGRFKAGHIPGAGHLYWEELVDPATGRFLSRDALRQRFETAGLDQGDTLVSYCAIGMRASVNYFLGRLLDYDVKFYDGSWNEWSLTDHEIATGPDPSAPFSEAARRDEGGWVSLFDGYTLTGWQASENRESWSVEDGTLTCHGPRSHLYFEGGPGEDDNTFTNFELRAEVRTTPGSNSGIYFHTRYQETGWPRYGYEAQVNLTGSDPKRSGSLYDVVNVTEQHAKDGEWYTQTIRVEGQKVTLSIDGKVLVDYEEPPGKQAHSEAFERRLGSGTFALQAHDPKSKVQFRNLRVRRLDPADAGE